MIDSYGRKIDYIRFSITDKCNYRCKYCMPEDGVLDIGHQSVLRYEELLAVAKSAVSLGITKFRITGGEPLVRRGVVDFIKKLKEIEGVKEVAMTTNGSLLKDYAKDLKEAGLDRVNVSLDTLRYDRFKEITRTGNLEDVYAGINEAVKEGLTPIKINVVVMKGFNEDEVMDFVQMTLQHPFEVRFIELMPFSGNVSLNGSLISNEEIKKMLPLLKPLEINDGVARLYTYPQAKGRIGFISPLSSCFCDKCNKVRVTSDGKLKTCLHSNKEIDLNKALQEAEKTAFRDLSPVIEEIKKAILSKERRHSISPGKSVTKRNMNSIGG